tara:strand:+ start:611 stop:1552 length:942 start_codon:yes stop_codon:yes gene_type:complete
MSDQLVDQLDEFKADGDDSEVMEPTAATVKKRKADKATAKEAADAEDNGEDGEDDETKVIKASAKKKRADKSMGEAVDEIFGGEDLSEDFKERAAVLFETVVLGKVNAEVERLEEEFSSKLDEQAELATEDLTKKVDAYLDYVAEQWMEENTLAVESGIRSDIAESFISGLKELFSEHRIDVPEEEVDLVAEMAEKIEALEASLNEQIDTNIEVSKELDEAKKSDVFDSLCEGIANTQAEKLRSLTEGLEYVDLDDFKRKVEIIKENYFGKSEISEEVDELDPIVDDSEDTKYVDPQMARYAQAISKTFRNIK